MGDIKNGCWLIVTAKKIVDKHVNSFSTTDSKIDYLIFPLYINHCISSKTFKCNLLM